MKFCNCLSRIFRIKWGKIWVSGEQELLVRTGWKPNNIWTCFDEHHSCGGCSQEKDCFDISVTKNGFVVKYSVHGSKRKVRWIAFG